MNDVKQRLEKCFSAVFPELSLEEIEKSTACHAANWDSLSAVTLLAVVQEEFGIDLDVNDMESFRSFEEILKRVNEAIRSRTLVEGSVADQARV
jgi:acyl carrier protein